jgi:hypothetical protein
VHLPKEVSLGRSLVIKDLSIVSAHIFGNLNASYAPDKPDRAFHLTFVCKAKGTTTVRVFFREQNGGQGNTNFAITKVSILSEVFEWFKDYVGVVLE